MQQTHSKQATFTMAYRSMKYGGSSDTDTTESEQPTDAL